MAQISAADATISAGEKSGEASSTATGRALPGSETAPACTLVVFGAGGDLTKRLLMPALYNLAGSHLLDDGLKIIGVDHGDNSDEGWRKSLTDTMQSFTTDKTAEFHADHIDEEAWGWIRSRLFYLKGDFEKPDLYSDLTQRLNGNVVFYLAVAARFFGPVIDRLGESGLLKQDDKAFRRVVIEKPFGSDLTSARALNQRILKQADESQFYRIDHFLGKETVQSILAIRFANTIFEPIWRREHVDHVQITAAETIGVEARGAFYEQTGALRDMVPNHMFQLLCMTAMEPPNSFDAEAIRSEKVKLVEAIRPVHPNDAARGQYGAGSVLGHKVAAYRDEPHVAPDSRTETYAALKLTIDNWRWAGVPFYIRTGKHLAARRTEIAIQFKTPPYSLFRDTAVEKHSAEPAAIADRPVRRHRDELQRQGSGTQNASRRRDDDVPIQGFLHGAAERRLRNADLRLHDRRRDALPARGQHRNELGGGRSFDRGLVKGPADRVCGGQHRTGVGRRASRP